MLVGVWGQVVEVVELVCISCFLSFFLEPIANCKLSPVINGWDDDDDVRDHPLAESQRS